jgi:hypothetical protein
LERRENRFPNKPTLQGKRNQTIDAVVRCFESLLYPGSSSLKLGGV